MGVVETGDGTTSASGTTVDAHRDVPIDGRRARRERSRVAVIDAVFALIKSGKIPPAVEDVAALAGVSVSSVFRNFQGIDDLQRHAVDRFREQYAHLFTAEPESTSDRGERISRFIEVRIELFEQAGPLMALARQRALDYEPMVEAVARNRAALADQVRAWFAPELVCDGPGEVADMVALLDSFTSPEAYDVMRSWHARSRRQIARSWATGLDALTGGTR